MSKHSQYICNIACILVSNFTNLPLPWNESIKERKDELYETKKRSITMKVINRDDSI